MHELTCHDCGVSWEAKRRRAGSDGKFRCKPCAKALANRKWEESNPDYQKAYSQSHTAERTVNSQKWNERNRARRREIDEKYRASDKGRINQRVRGRRYYETHREELLQKASDRYYQLTPHMARMLKEDPCAICGTTEEPTLDHMWPRAKGGQHININMQILCRSCNSFKKDRIFLADNAGWLVGL